MSKSLRMAELKKRLEILEREIRSIPGGGDIWLDQQPGSAKHMYFDGGAGKMYVKPRGINEYEIALSTNPLVDEMGSFMIEQCGKQPDKYNHPGRREPCWWVTDFEIVRRAVYRYAHKSYQLPDEVSLAPVQNGEKALMAWVEENEQRAAALPLDLLQKRAEQAPAIARKVDVLSATYIRNPEVSNYAKRRANGICDLCGTAAPFSKPTGEPYLESHHVKWISNGGEDSINNVVALCPNCHRKMHVLNRDEDIEKLEQQILQYGR